MTKLIVALLVFTSFKSAAQTQPSPPMTPAPSGPALALTTAVSGPTRDRKIDTVLTIIAARWRCLTSDIYGE